MAVGERPLGFCPFPDNIFRENGGPGGGCLPAVPERGKVDGDDVEPVKEVFPESPFLDFFPKVLVGGRNQSDVHFFQFGSAHGGKFPLLDDPQQLALDG